MTASERLQFVLDASPVEVLPVQDYGNSYYSRSGGTLTGGNLGYAHIAVEPRSRAGFMCALHEIGHAFTDDIAPNLFWWDIQDVTVGCLESEALAWEWALDHCPFKPRREDWLVIYDMFGSYVNAGGVQHTLGPCAKRIWWTVLAELAK